MAIPENRFNLVCINNGYSIFRWKLYPPLTFLMPVVIPFNQWSLSPLLCSKFTSKLTSPFSLCPFSTLLSTNPVI